MDIRRELARLKSSEAVTSPKPDEEMSPPQIDRLYGEHLEHILKLMDINSIDLKGETFDTMEKNILYYIDSAFHSSTSWVLDHLGEDMQWINTAAPSLSLESDLANKILIVDFFTLCCINCIHILPLLKQIETEYQADPGVVVIGVHSPKFPNEKGIDRLVKAVAQFDIDHPVINDPNNVLWKKFGVFCWPTVFVFGPLHQLLFVLVGESEIEKLPFIMRCIMISIKHKNIELNRNVLPVRSYKSSSKPEALCFPQGISVKNDMLVSDTCNHRLLLLTLDGTVKHIIGRGIPGFSDGTFEEACFNFPRGTAWASESVVYVADTDNHAIRLINFEEGCVSTTDVRKPTTVDMKAIQVYGPFEKRCDKIPETKLLSPWDVCVAPEYGKNLSSNSNSLYVAAAGSHQIWSMPLCDNGHPRDICVPFAGSGKEGYRNNIYKYVANFAQPSGITYAIFNPGYLYISDTESSSIRSINLETGSVQTVVAGASHGLFNYGDKDGISTEVLLQHPLGICSYKEHFLLIADTYNHKIKLLDLLHRQCHTLAGAGTGSLKQVNFHEPSALCVNNHNQQCFVCDTNSHKIKVFDEAFGLVETVTVMQDKIKKEEFYRSSRITICHEQPAVIPEVKVSPSGEINIICELLGADNLNLEKEAPQPYEIQFSGLDNTCLVCHTDKLFKKKKPSFQEPALIIRCNNYCSNCTVGDVSLKVVLTTCDRDGSFCARKEAKYNFKVKLDSEIRDAFVRLVCNLH